MRISDWSSDVCSSDLVARGEGPTPICPPDKEARALFDRLGTAIELADESAFDIFTAASAKMASYFAFAHSITAWMQRHGTDAAQAHRFVAQMLKGLSETAAKIGRASCRARVCQYV